MKQQIKTCAFFVAGVFCLIGCSDNVKNKLPWKSKQEEKTMSMDTSTKKKGSELFVLHAKDSNIIPTTKNGEYTFTLYVVDDYVTYFSAPPERKAGKMTLDTFMEVWKKNFASDDPNAGVVSASYMTKNTNRKKFMDVSVVLSNPVYEKEHNRLIFNLKSLNASDRIRTGNLGSTSIFIDNVPTFFTD